MLQITGIHFQQDMCLFFIVLVSHLISPVHFAHPTHLFPHPTQPGTVISAHPPRPHPSHPFPHTNHPPHLTPPWCCYICSTSPADDILSPPPPVCTTSVHTNTGAIQIRKSSSSQHDTGRSALNGMRFPPVK